MTLLQLIAHLKEVYEEHGNLENVTIIRPDTDQRSYEAYLDQKDIEKSFNTITFT